jgi:hypothetical protein
MSAVLASTPFGLSLSKAFLPSGGTGGGRKGFDKLSPNGPGSFEKVR